MPADPTRPCTCLLCLHPAPWPQPPRPDRPVVVTIMGVADPGPLILTIGYQSKQTSTFSWPLRTACTWCPTITPNPDYRFRPGAPDTATAIQE
jgi:hypothetical protein